MKPIRWSAEKSLSLKAERGVSFEEVLSAISQGGLLSVMGHPNRAKYGHQKMLVVRIQDYVSLVPYVEGEIARLRAAAEATLLKNKRVNIRISSRDLERLQARAAEEGVPYQTLMASVLHEFVSGRLVETQRRITTRSSRTARKRAAA